MRQRREKRLKARYEAKIKGGNGENQGKKGKGPEDEDGNENGRENAPIADITAASEKDENGTTGLRQRVVPNESNEDEKDEQ